MLDDRASEIHGFQQWPSRYKVEFHSRLILLVSISTITASNTLKPQSFGIFIIHSSSLPTIMHLGTDSPRKPAEIKFW
jgi:hypothetical protein